MIHLVRSQVVDASAPAIWWWSVNDQGYLADSQAAEWRVYSRASGAWAAYTSWAAVDLVATKLGTGRYAASWTVPIDAPYGVYVYAVRWRLAAADAWTVYGYEFEIHAGGVSIEQPTYAFLADLTAEGISGTAARMASCLGHAGKFTDLTTGQRFAPYYLDKFYVNGSGDRDLELGMPIIAVEDVVIVDYERAEDWDYDPDDIIVFNRHMIGVTDPDDRRDPHLSMAGEDGYFAEGEQNIKIRGIFGYVEPTYDVDGTVLVVNRPPSLIRHVNVIMSWKKLPLLGDAERWERDEQHRITQESTEGQSYTMEGRIGPKFLSGDTSVDSILYGYRYGIRSARV